MSVWRHLPFKIILSKQTTFRLYANIKIIPAVILYIYKNTNIDLYHCFYYCIEIFSYEALNFIFYFTIKGISLPIVYFRMVYGSSNNTCFALIPAAYFKIDDT